MKSNFGFVIVVVGLLHIGTYCGRQCAAQTTSAAVSAKLASETQAFLGKHCHQCHSGPKPKGDFDLKGLPPTFSDKPNRQQWRKVVEQLQAGTMPPKEKPRPADADTKAVAGWINGQVA